MIKISFESHEEGIKKPEITTAVIYSGRNFVRYNIPNKAKSVVDQMRKDGRRNVLFSRGVMLELYPDKTEEEILEIVQKDIINGVYVAEKKTGKKIEIKNIKIQRS